MPIASLPIAVIPLAPIPVSPIITNIKCVKFIDILVDCTLTLKLHIDALLSRIRKLIYVFKNLQ